MGAIYVAALILGLGVLGLGPLLPGGDGHASEGAEDELGATHGDHHAADATTALAFFLSLRFWTFGLAGFGLVGTALHFLSLTGALATGVLAVLVGGFSGALSTYTFRALKNAQTQSGSEADAAVGQVGRVLLGIEAGKRGKIRVEIRGQVVDLLASTDESSLGEGTEVVVEEMRGTTAHVARASSTFLGEAKRG
jgi:membrane protein implicated in regulation of membrane protease activity